MTPASGPLATVLICTRDRAASLAHTLESLVAAGRGVTDGDWELLIVDNGSSDGTADTVASFRDRLPVRTVREETPGLSRARNTGVDHARGRYAIWTDDDVLVDRDWLHAYLAAFRRHPEAAVFGGRAVPRFEEPRRAWFEAASGTIASLLAIRDEPSWDAITPQRVPYGLNYAVRMKEQRAHRYDVELGVAPGRRRGGEETSLIREILAAGGTGAWVWDATVHHLIPAERQTAAYIYRFYRAHGQVFPVVPLPPGARRRDVWPALSRAAAGAAAGVALKRATGRPGWVGSLVKLARIHGTADRLALPESERAGGAPPVAPREAAA